MSSYFIDCESKSTFVESADSIVVLDVAPAVYQNLHEWFGGCTGRRADNDLGSVVLDGFFNRTNRPGAVLTISKRAYSKAGTELRQLIEIVLHRDLPMPYPIRDHYYRCIYMGELIVEGYARTTEWKEADMPEEAVFVDPYWLVKTECKK